MGALARVELGRWLGLAPFDLYTFQPIRLVAPRCVVSLCLLILAPVTRAPLSLGSVLAAVVFG